MNSAEYQSLRLILVYSIEMTRLDGNLIGATVSLFPYHHRDNAIILNHIVSATDRNIKCLQ